MPQRINGDAEDVEGIIDPFSKQGLGVSQGETGPTIVPDAWLDVENALKDHPPQQNPSVFAKWIRWLHQLEKSSDAGDLFCDDKYWRLIQQGLRANSAEQRKYCLYILNKSIALLDQDVNTPRIAISTKDGQKRYFTEAYEKYSILFQAFVLDRYVNQVEECLPELKELATPFAAVEPSWITILIGAALHNGVQDSVRKAVGVSFMDWDLMTYSSTDVWSDFLAHSFLPWACQGYLFEKSIKETDAVVQCKHGDRLSSFVDRLVNLCEDEDATLQLCRQVLSYIAENTRLFSAAGPYLLDGLTEGLLSLPSDADIRLGQPEQELAVKVASRTGLPPITRDLQISQCLKLSTLNRTNDFADRAVAPSTNDALQSQIEGLRRSLMSSVDIQRPSEGETDSIQELVNKIEESNHRSLRGNGLVEVLDSTIRSLRADPEVSTATCVELFTSIWDEIQVQDYPKAALILAPAAFLHPSCISAATTSLQLSSFLSKVMSDLQDLSVGRIYAFDPLAKALHCSYSQCSDILYVLAADDFIVHFANNPPMAKPEFLLEVAIVPMLQRAFPDRSYAYYYGEREAIGYARIMVLLNHLRPEDWSLGRQILDRLLEPWEKQKPPVPMVSKWKTTMQMQLILILCERCVDRDNAEQVKGYVNRFMKVLSIEPLPRYRILLEWIIVSLLEKDGAARDEVLAPLRSPEHDNPKFLASLLKVVVQVCRLHHSPESFGLRLMTAMVAMCASPKIVVRHEAQWSFLAQWDIAVEREWSSLTGNVAFSALNDYIRTLDRYKNPPPQRALERFDVRSDRTLVILFEGDYLKIDPPEEVMVRRGDFEKIGSEAGVHGLPEAAIPLGEPKSATNVVDVGPAQETDTPTPRTSTAGPLQTKSSAWQNTLSNPDMTLQTSAYSHREVRPITVFASHIAFAHNLGGISRAAEIFGAEALVVGKAEIVKDRAFLGVSVNSHLHLPIEEVKNDEKSVRAWLTGKRSQGYGVVGVEQTDKSIVLGASRSDGAANAGIGLAGEVKKVLPKKCVLVLGSEKEGIPGWLLAECDLCVEIPQVGVTRSLNVQTAAAVVLYEYGREWAGAT